MERLASTIVQVDNREGHSDAGTDSIIFDTMLMPVCLTSSFSMQAYLFQETLSCGAASAEKSPCVAQT